MIQTLNNGMIGGYMLIPQVRGANCTTRTSACFGNLSNNMNHQIQVYRQLNVSWAKQ